MHTPARLDHNLQYTLHFLFMSTQSDANGIKSVVSLSATQVYGNLRQYKPVHIYVYIQLRIEACSYFDNTHKQRMVGGASGSTTTVYDVWEKWLKL